MVIFMASVKEYILENWEKTVRFHERDEELKCDEEVYDVRIGLPKPYTVPSISGRFQEMYYWDTYFINRGMILSGMLEQAKNNTENMFFLIDKYGFMPNGNRHCYLNNSQPPFLSLMVKDIYDETGDKEWLKNAVCYLKKEYDFWENNRKTEIGLNQYSCNKEGAIAKKKYIGFVDRIGKRPEGYTDEQLSCQYITICESGWDITPRFGFETENYVQVELNALLYALEANLAEFSRILGMDGADAWQKKAEDRKALMRRYMLKDGIYYDYDFKNGKISDQFTCASIYPMFIGLLHEDEAKPIVDDLHRLETEYGIADSEKQAPEYQYQWQYPNGWAPHQNIVMQGLIRYGYADDALRVAQKYVRLVDENFKKTDNLWEKYNVVTGGIDVADEGSERHSTLPPMMGWTAGVYLEALQFSENNQ